LKAVAGTGPRATPADGTDHRMGLRLAVLSAAIGVAAVNTGNNLLYLMLSLALGLGGVSLAAARWSLRRLHVTPMLPEEATCGEPFLVGVEVSGRFPLLPQTWVRVRLEGLPEPLELTVAVPGGTGRGVASSRFAVGRRGVFERLTVQALTGYPLDLSLRRARQGWRGRLVVLPRFERISRLRIAGAAGATRRGGLNAPSRRPGGAGADLYNIREYTMSDDARHIDWRSSARTGRLMVRELEREEERRLDLVLDVRAGDADSFEAAVGRCAAILDLARRSRFDARLLVPGHDTALTGRSAMRCLAAVSHGGPPLEAVLAFVRREAELVVISADPARSTPLEIS